MRVTYGEIRQLWMKAHGTNIPNRKTYLEAITELMKDFGQSWVEAKLETVRTEGLDIQGEEDMTTFDGDQDEIYGITKEMFQEYEDLRRSGKTNMWGASRYLGWNPVPVISHYLEMAAHWPDVKGEA